MTWAVFLVFLSISTNERLQMAREFYLKGEFFRAARELSSLLSSGQLREAAEIVMARRYLGASYFILGEQGKAKDEFKEILRLAPNVELSLMEFPPEIVSFFNNVKKEGMKTAEETGQVLTPPTAALKEETPESQAGSAVTMAAPGPKPSVEERGSLALTLLPFGVGQLYQGEKIKGYILMGGETALLTVNLITLFQRLSMRNSDGTYTDPQRAESLQGIQNISAIGFYAALAYGFGDALWGYFKKGKVEPGASDHSEKNRNQNGRKEIWWGLALGTREAFQIWLIF